MKKSAFIFTSLFLFGVAYGTDAGNLSCSEYGNANATAGRQGVTSSISLTNALLLILGFGVFAAVIAGVFHALRKHVYHDADNLDTHFDAGGKVSIGLTATTIVSQWTWSATLLQSATVASKYGISGPFWYASGATIQVILFAILSIQMKTKAPGAKTFLQVVQARFGKATHIVFCVFAGFTNLVVTASLLLAGTAVITSLVSGLSLELAAMIVAIVIGSYTMIGGLGATFYVSYFNTSLIFVLVLIIVIEVYHNPSGDINNPIGSASNMYKLLSCSEGPDGNEQNSYLTFLSSGGLMFGVINVVGNFGTVFCDQSYWQSSVAAKPVQGVWGFVAGGLTWFAIPFTLATTTGLAYLAFGTEQGLPLLTPSDVDAGLVPPVVAQRLLGEKGEYVMLLLILMAVMSTGSAEIIAVASIVIFDIYQMYINPFRQNHDDENCLLCNLPLPSGNKYDTCCECPPPSECEACQLDLVTHRESKASVMPAYKCSLHGEYRQYRQELLHYKNWCIVWVTLLTIPLVLFCHAAQLNLSWVYLFTGVLIGSAVIPISLSISWSRINAASMISGAVVGCACGFISWLVTASTFDGGLTDFLKNTGREVSMLVGNCVSILVGGLVCIVVALITNWKQTAEEAANEWEKTRNIDNPLSPWHEMYKETIAAIDQADMQGSRPTWAAFNKLFKRAKIIAFSVGIGLSVILIIVWPSAMVAIRVMNENHFQHWANLSQAWAFIAAAFIIIVPLVQEIIGIRRRYLKNHDIKKCETNMNGVSVGRSNPAYVTTV